MITLAAVPLLVSVLLCCFGARVAARLRPNVAVPLFSAVALTVSLSTGLALSVLAVLVCVQLEPLPSWGQWSPATLRTGSGVPLAVGFAALVVVVWCLAAGVVRAVRSWRTLRAAARAARRFTPVVGDVVVIDVDEPAAYTVATPRGPIVVSGAMLAALTAQERRALLAHERSHLRHRHYRYLHAVRLASAANPLLTSTADAVARAVERWADEDAAAEVGDRTLVARALARAGLARAGRAAGGATLAAADARVAERARMLLDPPPRSRLVETLLPAAVAAASATAAVVVMLRLRDLVEVAELLYPHL
jgi:Zn-dependent protease with chaperone function